MPKKEKKKKRKTLINEEWPLGCSGLSMEETMESGLVLFCFVFFFSFFWGANERRFIASPIDSKKRKFTTKETCLQKPCKQVLTVQVC